MKKTPAVLTVAALAIREYDLRREIAETGRTAATQQIADQVKAGRCASELRNPQGSCCLGSVAAAARALGTGGAVLGDQVGAGEEER